MPYEPLEPVWELREPDDGAAEALSAATGLRPLLARLLVARGISEEAEARAFLQPRLGQVPDPATMAGMDRAADRIIAAIEGGERICVWGDYDVDGVTSASQLLLFLRGIGADTDYFVPDRFTDGYGLNPARMREIVEAGARLVITVDCGVSDVESVAVANELGVDVVIVDHHQVPPEMPAAYAILDPHQPGCPFPDKRLAACGVTWMLLIELRRRLRAKGFFAEGEEPDLRQWLDLTAIGTVADMVPLMGVNRLIVRYGLERIVRSEKVGVQALREVSRLANRATITAGHIGFMLGPRINAAGRVAHARAGVELLTTDDADLARSTAELIDRHNTERRQIQTDIFEAACRMADAHPAPSDRRSVVLAAEGWHPGVLGIVASKLIERYHRPTILLAIDGEKATGSARSISGFKLVDHLRRIDSHLLRYGGHDHAAGLTLTRAELPAFEQAFEAEAAATLKAKHLQPRLRLDAELPLAEVDQALIEDLGLLAPYGMGNPEPSFMARHVDVLDARLVGQDRGHVKLTLAAGGHDLDAIAFGQAERAPRAGERIDVAYVPELNVYRGETRIQARIKAMRPSEW